MQIQRAPKGVAPTTLASREGYNREVRHTPVPESMVASDPSFGKKTRTLVQISPVVGERRRAQIALFRVDTGTKNEHINSVYRTYPAILGCWACTPLGP